MGVILVVQHDVEQQAVLRQQRGHAGQKPAGHRIGIDGHTQRLPAGRSGCARRRTAAQPLEQIRLHQPHLAHMGQQGLARRRGGDGFAAHKQALAQRLFQRLDAQRHGGQRDVERLRRRQKTALLGHGGQGFELAGIQHIC